jgi:drug/metabolite transporter (DMT)-like permease
VPTPEIAERRLRLQRRADLALLAVTAAWGITFVTVKDALEHVGPLTFVAARFALSALAMLPFVRPGRRPRSTGARATPALGQLARAGALAGLFLFGVYALQTGGLVFTTASRAGFITGLSVVIVPVVAAILTRRRPPPALAAGVALATLGLALLSLPSGAGEASDLGLGDLLVLGCALSVALHILVVGRFAPRLEPISFTWLQLSTVAVLSTFAALAWERPSAAGILAAWPAILFTGLVCTVAGFGLQTWAQRFTSPTHTALIFSAEPVFAAAFAWAWAGEHLGPPELAGCALILAGMVVAQLAPDRRLPLPAESPSPAPS